jgi:hypothetical protein
MLSVRKALYLKEGMCCPGNMNLYSSFFLKNLLRRVRVSSKYVVGQFFVRVNPLTHSFPTPLVYSPCEIKEREDTVASGKQENSNKLIRLLLQLRDLNTQFLDEFQLVLEDVIWVEALVPLEPLL